MIQFSIRMLCAKYQETGMCGCDRIFSISHIYQNYLKFWQTWSVYAADLKLSYRYNSQYWWSVPNIRKLSHLVPIKYVTEIFLYHSYFKNILSLDKQELDRQQIWNCLTRYSFQYSVPNIRKLSCMVPEKNVTELFLHQQYTCIWKIFQVPANWKWTCGRFEPVLQDTVLHTDALCQISASCPMWFLRKIWQKLLSDTDARQWKVIPIFRFC